MHLSRSIVLVISITMLGCEPATAEPMAQAAAGLPWWVWVLLLFLVTVSLGVVSDRALGLTPLVFGVAALLFFLAALPQIPQFAIVAGACAEHVVEAPAESLNGLLLLPCRVACGIGAEHAAKQGARPLHQRAERCIINPEWHVCSYAAAPVASIQPGPLYQMGFPSVVS